MSSFSKKSKFKSLLYSPVFLLLFLVIIIIFAGAVYDLYLKNRDATKSNNISKAQLNELREKQQTLNDELNSLQTDRGLDETIRDKFRVVKGGEELIVIPDSETPALQTKKVNTITEKKFGFWQILKEWFSTK